MRKIAIAAERDAGQISFFDPDTLQLVVQYDLDMPFYGVAITADCNKAVAVCGSSTKKFLVEFNTQNVPALAAAIPSATRLRDVDITPDGRYAVAVDGANPDQSIRSFDLATQMEVSALASATQAVAISPAGNGLILAASNIVDNTIEIYNISPSGTLSNIGSTVQSGAAGQPINIAFTPNSNFAFAVHFLQNTIGILDTSNPNDITFLTAVTTQTVNPQTIVVNPASSKVYVLTVSAVEIFNFSAGTLSFDTSFNHNLAINTTTYVGFKQMSLDPTTNHLFISASGTGSGNHGLWAFTTDGQVVGQVSGVAAFGGVAVRGVDQLVRGIKFFD